MHKIRDVLSLGVCSVEEGPAVCVTSTSPHAALHSAWAALSGAVLGLVRGESGGTTSSVVCTLWKRALASPHLVLQVPGPAPVCALDHYDNEIK